MIREEGEGKSFSTILIQLLKTLIDIGFIQIRTCGLLDRLRRKPQDC